jgi:hypothetical protein
VPLREVWPHEARDFTIWLEENIDLLNEYLPVPIDPESVAHEAPAGVFAVDLVATDDAGEPIVIENQLEKSNHDHLGKLITYAAARSAKTAIWIVAEPRDEHVRAISWLNDADLAEFWLFKIEAIRIGDSLPAPMLTKIVGPAEERGPVRDSGRRGGPRTDARRAYNTQLLAYAQSHNHLHDGVSPGRRPWLGKRVAPGVSWVYGIRTGGTRVMLYIERGAGHLDVNDAIYDSLLGHREAIEAAFGNPLSWEAKENNRSRTLCYDLTEGGWTEPDKWPDAIEATVATMVKLEEAVRPFLPDAITAGNAMASLSSSDDDSEIEESLETTDEEGA